MLNEWAQIASNGTISNLLKVFAEGGAEFVRYLEYLYQEKKFKNSRNISSVTSQTDLIAYKRQLPKSAVGYIVVAPTDKDGKNRLANYGIEFFDLDAASDYDELTKNEKATTEEKSSLIPWTANEAYCIPKGTIIKSAAGIPYIVTESVESRSLKEPFSVIKKDPTKYADFIAAGGWDGIKYIKVPIIQGEKVSTQLGQARGTRYESFSLNTLDAENASNIISCDYFTVSVKPFKKVNGEDVEDGDTQIWEKVENIGLAGPYDKVFEVKILDDEEKLLIKFGDGITGKLLPKDAIITVNYLKTMGEAGNTSSKFQLTDITLPNGQQMIDPRTNQVSNFLCCTNISPVMGGKDIEDVSDIKKNAPPSYLKSYTTSSKKVYLKQIIENSPVNLLHTHLFKSEVVDGESYGTSNSNSEYTSSEDDSFGIIQEITATKNALLVSALRCNGENIEDPEGELIIPLRQALDDYMSPNDAIEFIQPNVVKLCPRIIVSTTSTILESDIFNKLRPDIYSEFSIFNRDFGKKYFKSEIIDITHDLTFANSVDCFLEAKVKADLEPTILTKTLQKGREWLNYVGNTSNNMKTYDTIKEDNETLFAFDFSFDKIFAQNSLARGFKNFRLNSPYLLKVDVIFRENAENSRTLFLYDNRIDLKNDVEINNAYNLPVDSNKSIPVLSKSSYGNTQLNWPQNESEAFRNLQARTAQYTLIDKITSVNFMDQAKNFLNSPYEIRPLYIDDNGKNKVFNLDDVPVDSRVSLNFDGNVNTSTCYRKNWQYWNHCKIEFYENYDDPSSENYACGRVIIPVKNILSAEEITSLKTLFENVENFDDQTPDIKKMLTDKLEINVYAIPVQEEFECNNEFDIIATDKDDIKIEKKFILKG